MSKSRHTEAQIIAALKQVEAGRTTEDVAREQGVSKQTIYACKAKYGGMEVSEAEEVKHLRDENARLKVAQRFSAEVNKQAKKFMFDELVTVDGMLIQAWASQKSFRPRTVPEAATERTSMTRSFPTTRMNRLPIPSPALQEELWERIEAELFGPCAGGEPQRSDCRRHGDPRGWIRRARCCVADAES